MGDGGRTAARSPGRSRPAPTRAGRTRAGSGSAAADGPPPRAWTTPADLTATIADRLDSGAWLREHDDDGPRFPLRLAVRGPRPKDLLENLPGVRAWVAGWDRFAAGPGVVLEWSSLGGRAVGTSDVPVAVTIASVDDAARLARRTSTLAAFRTAREVVAERRPGLLPWVDAQPARAVTLAAPSSTGTPGRTALDDLLAVVDWFEANPRSGRYLRQVDIPGLDTKFLEEHRGTLGPMLDLALPEVVVDPAALGLRGFARRYGLRDAADVLVRVRVLDPGLEPWPGAADLALTPSALASLPVRPDVVVVTENRVNLLALPPVPGTLALFGAGYGFAALRTVAWLRQVPVLYWGDIDTHGFAILDQLRADGVRARSLLMDVETLLAHRPQWVEEHSPNLGPLPRLDDAEAQLYRDLVDHRYGERVRLEQERIPFGLVEAALREAALREAAREATRGG